MLTKMMRKNVLRSGEPGFATRVFARLLLAGTAALAAAHVSAAPPRQDPVANFGNHTPSASARQLADWVAASRDNAGAGFIVVDKIAATVYVFDSTARLNASTPVLLGSARGDDSAPGIGDRPLSEVGPEQRTTPAGRFVAERGRNAQGEDVVWVDYDAAVSMHRVRANNPKERRLERLATPGAQDNRISYGCINVPLAFYEARIRPMFAANVAVVYVLPETKPWQQVFRAEEIAANQAGRPQRTVR